MKIGIISAMEKEVTNFRDQMKEVEIIHRQHITFYVGKIFHHEIILVVGGIGKVSTGMICATMINTFDNIQKIINVGVSGGIKNHVKPGDIVIGRYYSYADADLTSIENVPFGQMANMPRLFTSDKEMVDSIKFDQDCIYGDILSGDTFFSDKSKVDELINTYFSDISVCAMDMESTAFAQACYVYNIPFIAIRAISDVIGNDNQNSEYFDYVKIACQKSNIALMKILERI